MIKKMAVAGIAVSVLGFGCFASDSADARGRGSWGHHSSYSSPSSHPSYSSQPHASYAQAPHATAPMAPPAAEASKPSVLGSIATTAAGTAGGVVAGNALSHAFEGNGDGKDSKSEGKSSSNQANNDASAVPVVTDSSGAAHGLPQAADPCTPENEAKNPRIEELCGQLHQELRKVNDTAKEQAAAQK